MNGKGVFRTAPATPGLLISEGKDGNKKKDIYIMLKPNIPYMNQLKVRHFLSTMSLRTLITQEILMIIPKVLLMMTRQFKRVTA